MQLFGSLVQGCLGDAAHFRTAEPQRTGHQALVLPQLLGGVGVETVVAVGDGTGAGQRAVGRGFGADESGDHGADHR